MPVNTTAGYLYARLSTDATLIDALGGTKIYHTVAPPGVDVPYVTFQPYSQVEEQWPGRAERTNWLVRCIANTQMLAGSIDSIVCDIIHNREGGTYSGWTVYDARRKSSIWNYDDAAKNFYSGGVFQLRTKQVG